jgi:hypothetical protein
MKNQNQKPLTKEQALDTLRVIKTRFEQNMKRHSSLNWSDLETKLLLSVQKIWSLREMERTGGEPDVVAYDSKLGEFIFYDCSIESPLGRRSTCYDIDALESRKKFKPETSAIELADAMGVDLLTEEQYHDLQKLGEFDLKTSSWVYTPENIRKLGGAIFCDRRFNRVFTYHNGAESYYAARGFRCVLRV